MRQYVVGLDFGYPKDARRRSTIDDLAELIFQNYAGESETVVLAQECIYEMLCQYGFPRERLIEVRSGQSSTDGTKGGGSYHTLRMAARMIREDLGRTWLPIEATVVAHALHVRRVVRQGRLFDLRLTAAEGLPTTLYRNAAQWWCRNRPAWYLREAIGFIPLRLAGQV